MNVCLCIWTGGLALVFMTDKFASEKRTVMMEIVSEQRSDGNIFSSKRVIGFDSRTFIKQTFETLKN